jgi:hypothetical protein
MPLSDEPNTSLTRDYERVENSQLFTPPMSYKAATNTIAKPQRVEDTIPAE